MHDDDARVAAIRSRVYTRRCAVDCDMATMPRINATLIAHPAPALGDDRRRVTNSGPTSRRLVSRRHAGRRCHCRWHTRLRRTPVRNRTDGGSSSESVRNPRVSCLVEAALRESKRRCE